MQFINNTEKNAYGVGFSVTEISKTESTVTDENDSSVTGTLTTTIIYAGKAPKHEDIPALYDDPNWQVRKTCIEENSLSGQTVIHEFWAKGSWNDRGSLVYQYQ